MVRTLSEGSWSGATYGSRHCVVDDFAKIGVRSKLITCCSSRSRRSCYATRESSVVIAAEGLESAPSNPRLCTLAAGSGRAMWSACCRVLIFSDGEEGIADAGGEVELR